MTTDNGTYTRLCIIYVSSVNKSKTWNAEIRNQGIILRISTGVGCNSLVCNEGYCITRVRHDFVVNYVNHIVLRNHLYSLL